MSERDGEQGLIRWEGLGDMGTDWGKRGGGGGGGGLWLASEIFKVISQKHAYTQSHLKYHESKQLYCHGQSYTSLYACF